MLDYIWRILATGISFVVFGVGGFLLTIFVFPVINLKSYNPEQRRMLSREVIHKTFRFFIRMMAFFGMFDFKIAEAEKALSDQKGKIIIANHPSLIDVVVLIAILPHADCIVKRALWDNLFLKGVVSAARYIKSDDNVDEIIERCQDSLNSGYSIIIFPEGTRTRTGVAMKLHRGASNIALRCMADMIPVTIDCNPSTLTKNEPWYSIPERKADFSLTVGKPIKVTNFIKDGQSMSISARHLTDHMNDYFKKDISSYA